MLREGVLASFIHLRASYNVTGYEISMHIDFSEVKKDPYLKLNPNGRLPTIDDPNTGLQIWESGAIVEYLIETYDKSHLLSYKALPEQWQLKQWLFLQVSGQAPYYGRAAWFIRPHPEKSYRSARISVGTRQWLVGDKCTYADLSFIAWQRWAPRYGGEDIYEKFPHVGAWMERMKARPSVQKVLADQDRAIVEIKGN
ncbi:unnamed protein product [Penicillium nalgiovense]|nr:unnamed protein product [Penicillium nalgiovense]